MLRAMPLALVLLTGSLCCAVAEWFPARVENRSFERDTNRDGAPDGWATALFDSPAQATWDRETAHSGRASVRLSDSRHPDNRDWRANTARWVTTQSRACQAGEVYTLRGWLRTALTQGEAKLVFAWSKGGTWLHEDGTDPVSGESDWVERTLTVRAPDEADTVRVYLMLNSAVGTAWFDDVAAVPGAAFPGNFRPVDLGDACNTGFADDVAGDGQGGWTDQGPNDAREIPLGRQTWRDVPFEVIDPAANEGRSCIVLRGRGRETLPERVEFPVNERCEVLYFLHGCAWAQGGQLVGRYTITLDDGTEVAVPLRAGREVVDWWRPADTAESAVGWEGKNAETASVGLSIFPWRNPKPAVPVSRVRFESAADPVGILVAVTAGDGPPMLPEQPLKLEFTDTTGWYEWAFALDDPTLGEVDLSFLIDPPAGKHGFLTVREDGHFYFEDGTRARFFGTNVGGRNIAPDKRTAETVAERLSRYGINMLRLHVPDSRWGGLIDYSQGTSRQLDAEAFDRYDYFVAQLLERGIYVYFDLLDYRTFMPADGVRDADQMGVRWEYSIKGASIFDPRMIELQKEFATELLTHRNAYTGRRYVDEPGLAVQEITNENSLFYLSNQRLMLPSYVDDLRALWNEWLQQTYGGRQGLIEAWSRRGGETALLEDEDPAVGTVRLPLQHLYADLRGADYRGEKSPARCNAMTRFLYEMEIAYYDQMIEHLRGLGLKCPITGTNQDFSDASNLANAHSDFTSRNNYWCHPDVEAKPFQRFRNIAVVNSDIVTTENPVANVASSTVVGKPMIVPEFNFPYPNEYRAECLPLMAAYGRLQDWDGLLYFAYDISGQPLANFGNQSDPVRWGQVPMAALIFLRGDVDVARYSVHVGNSRVDCFSTRPRRTGDRYSPYRVLPYISKVRTAYFDAVYEGDADVAVSSGHSASGDYSRAQRAIVFADWPYADEAATVANRGASAEATVPGLRTLPAEGFRFDTVLDPDTLSEGMSPIGVEGTTVGGLSDRYAIMPHASALGDEDPAWFHRLYLEVAGRWGLLPEAPVAEAGRIFRSDTGQLRLDRELGLFIADTPRAKIAAGFLAQVRPAVELTGAEIACETPFASISLVSLDGEPVATSQKLLLTAVARAENTGQAFLNNHSAIPEWGRPPVIVEPVRARVTLRTAVPLAAHPLSPTGQRGAGGRVGGTRTNESVTFDLTEARSPWILLVSEAP